MNKLLEKIWAFTLLLLFILAIIFWVAIFASLDQNFGTTRATQITLAVFALFIGLPLYLASKGEKGDHSIMYFIFNIDLAILTGTMVGIAAYLLLSLLSAISPSTFDFIINKSHANDQTISAIFGILYALYRIGGSFKVMYSIEDSDLVSSFLGFKSRIPVVGNIRGVELEYYEEGEDEAGRIITIVIYLILNDGQKATDKIFECILDKSFDPGQNPFAFTAKEGYSDKEFLVRIKEIKYMGSFPWTINYTSNDDEEKKYDITSKVANLFKI